MTPLTINWLVPEPFPGAGGDVGLFRMVRYLAEFGHRCHVYVVAYDLMIDFTTEDVRKYVGQHFGQSDAQYYRFSGTVGEADATFATFWPTVEDMLKLPNGGRRYYLVQDFEPSFYPDEPNHYERAENTYRAGLRCITLGPWLARLLRSRYHATADHFDFAVDTSVYFARPVQRNGIPLVSFYARPATPRRAYEMGLAALRIVKERMPEVEICLFGSDELQPEPSFAVTQRGLLNAGDLAELFSQSDAGMVFSLSNPSFVPLEMLACGCPVVEIDSERWQGVLTHERNAYLVYPSARAAANGVLRILTDSVLRDRLIEQGITLTHKMSWCDSARQIEAILLRDLDDRIVALSTPALPSEKFAPRRYGLGAWTEHIFFAYDLVAQLRPKVLVELGTDRGESYFAFCQSVAENEIETLCFAIDHWRGDTHAGSYDETTFQDVTAHNLAHYTRFSTLARSTFDEALERFAPGSIDLLHLDGHHTEAAVRHDLESWLPKLRPGGILLMHDVQVRVRDFGVWKVWHDLRDSGRSFTFAGPPGLGVWEKPPGRNVPPILETLFGPSSKAKEDLLSYYRERNAQLQKRIMQHWIDGSIRTAPMASETVIQVFWTSDGSYSEERSTDVRVGHEQWKGITVELPKNEPVTGLRVDFYSPLTKIEIALVEVTDQAGTQIYRVVDEPGFKAIELGGDCVRRSLDPFVVEVTGVDPQLYLPTFSSSLAYSVSVRMRLRVQSQV